MLIPLARNTLPPPAEIQVAGPGPLEPTHVQDAAEENVAPMPPTKPTSPAALTVQPSMPVRQDTLLSPAIENSPQARAPMNPADPYSNLDGAFNNYMGGADDPRPMGGKDDDLLF